MEILFHIDCNADTGNSVFVIGGIKEIGLWDQVKARKMTKSGAGQWKARVKIPETDKIKFEYSYLIKDKKGEILWRENGGNRSFSCESKEDITIRDTWRDNKDPESSLISSAFTDVLFTRPARKKVRKVPGKKTEMIARLMIRVPRVESRYSICVIGNAKALGAGDEKKALVMDDSNYPCWEVEVPIEKNDPLITYKYAIYDTKEKKVVHWECADERTLKIVYGKKKIVARTDEEFVFPEGLWRGAGVSIPVFSLRSKNGLGVGEFLDIKLLADWSKKAGIKMIQILPINDTVVTHTWSDSYPYSSISVFALHPIYLNLQAMGRLPEKVVNDIFDEQRKSLNKKADVDYEAVMRLKLKFFKKLYDATKDTFLADREFKTFFEKNKLWLKPYAAFCFLRDLYGTSDFSQWGNYKTVKHKQIDKLTSILSPHYDDIAIHYFVQFHLHKQLSDVVAYTRREGIVLKGDLPIGVNRHSVETWANPELFNVGQQSGAPPDDFSVNGQNWGFPTYNWKVMAKDNYAWWRNRLKVMSSYFDALRIDHILGFFRIWEIPIHAVTGLMGRFNPAIPITSRELEESGVSLDLERLCTPYIRWHVVNDVFGSDAGHVVLNFMEEYKPGCFRMKPEFATQRQVDDFFVATPDISLEVRAYNNRIKQGLFTIISEILFIEEPGSKGLEFHPRITLQRTHSFKDLDPVTREKIDKLYIDYFYNRQEVFWRQEAMVKLPVLKSVTNMLICAEDLGMMPDCVDGVMSELGLLSLCIQRMPKSLKDEFGKPGHYPYLSVCSPSSHDMSTARGWWEEDRARSQRFYSEQLECKGDVTYFCEPWVCEKIVAQHLASPSMWSVFPIQDLVAINGDLRREMPQEEQINVPSNPKHYWRYRFHIDLEDLGKQKELNEKLNVMIEKSGR